MSNIFIKDPNAVEKFSIDWTAPLNGDSINTSTWIVPAGITKVADTVSSGITTVKLSGGTTLTRYRITNRITTILSTETLDQSLFIDIVEQ